jgi:hypothetical protein
MNFGSCVAMIAGYFLRSTLMKSPDQATFKTILIITMIVAIAMLPFVAKADSHKSHKTHSPPACSEFDANGMKKPTFEDLDLDGDGCINTEEFAVHQAERHDKK